MADSSTMANRLSKHSRDNRTRGQLTLIVHDIGDYGGMERVHSELIVRLVEQWNITVISCTLPQNLRHFVTWRRVRVPRRPAPLKFILFFVFAGLRLRFSEETGVVYSCGAIVPNRVDVASVHLCHAGLVGTKGRLTPERLPPFKRLNTSLQRTLALIAERWCYRPGRVRMLHAVSDGIYEEIERSYPGISVSVIPNGVDTEAFRPAKDLRVDLRNREAVPDAAFVALFVGGDWEHKGLEAALEGVSAARRRGVDARLWVVGRGDEERFTELARSSGVSKWVRFFGPVSDTRPYYVASDVFVLMSVYESFSLVAHEAAASGLPIVATAVHGIIELIGEDEAGVIVDRDAGHLGSVLSDLAQDPGRREMLGVEARRRAMNLGWDTTCRSVGEMLRSMQSRAEDEAT